MEKNEESYSHSATCTLAYKKIKKNTAYYYMYMV